MTAACRKFYQFGKCIGNPARFRMLELLLAGPMTVNVIARQLRLSQPAASQHLRVLRESGLVDDNKRGQEVHYTLNSARIQSTLRALLADFERRSR